MQLLTVLQKTEQRQRSTIVPPIDLQTVHEICIQ
jgi:hypothetical protein